TKEHGSDDLSDELKDLARAEVKTMIVRGDGVTFRHVPEHIDSGLSGARIKMPPGTSTILVINGQETAYPGLPILYSDVGIFDDDLNMVKTNMFKRRLTTGMRRDAYPVIQEYFSNLPAAILSRVIAYGRHFNKLFEIDTITAVDMLAFRALCVIAACAPSA